ncbi:MAG: type II toxin-antitoxin system HicB family antitoxin [Spirochaetales bacterium]|nr:type II toxin-antitoxin system HicB family antitoxin [Spirochaetales bacterium]
MTYKGYTGIVVFDEDARIFHGEVVGLKDIVTFQGSSVDELEKAMAESVDFYLDWCRERGKEPDKPYSGKLMLRTTPELHSQAVIAASRIGVSLNKYIEKAIEDENRHILAQ